jgi:hypothetical protein
VHELLGVNEAPDAEAASTGEPFEGAARALSGGFRACLYSDVNDIQVTCGAVLLHVLVLAARAPCYTCT